MGQNGAAVGQVPHFGPFPLKKINKRVPKRWKANLHQICFSKPRMILYHKGNPPVMFWDERGPGWGVVACNVETQCQKILNFELDFCPGHWVGPFGPKLHEPSSYTIQTYFA